MVNYLVVEGQFIVPLRYYTKSGTFMNCYNLGNSQLRFTLNSDLNFLVNHLLISLRYELVDT